MNRSDVLVAARELQLLSAPITDVMFHGYSMEPLLTERDRIVLQKVAFSDIRIGDIITYFCEDKYPTRRVVFKKQDKLGLWCDNWPERRFWTDADKVLARVVSRERNGEVLSSFDAEWVQLTKNALHTYRFRQMGYYCKRIRQLILRN